MTQKWSDLKAQMSPESQARVTERANEILAAMPTIYHTCGKQAASTASAVPLDPAPKLPCPACAEEPPGWVSVPCPVSPVDKGLDKHLLAAATLIASEDECVLLGPWRTIEEPWGRLYGITRGAPHPRTQHWFDTPEDARSVCAALNRNERVRQLGERR